jgi:protoheme ferro-lyase
MGGKELTVVKCLNDDDLWIDGLESLVKKRLGTLVV